MINIKETIEVFGYNPSNFTSGCSRKVIADCPSCHDKRRTSFRNITINWTCLTCSRQKSGKGCVKYTKDEDYFKIPNLINSYWAGFIAADGSLNPKTHTISILLKRSDKSHLEKLLIDSKFTGKIIDGSRKSTSSETFYSDLRIYGAKNWIKDLNNNFNITPNKTFTLNPPEKLTDKILKYAFLAGYIDVDGSIYTKNNPYLSILGTKQLIQWSKEILHSKGQGYERITQMKGVMEYRTGKSRLFNFYNEIKDLELPLMERKWNKIKEELNNANH